MLDLRVLGFLCTTTLQNPRAPRGFWRCRAADRGMKNCRQRFALRPGGTPQEISRGQARSAGAAPGCAAERAMPQRGIEEVFGSGVPAALPPPLVASGHFLRCPVGAPSQTARFPGAASAEADLPPANLLRRPSGTGPGVPPRGAYGVRRSSEYSITPFQFHALRRRPVALRFGCGPAALCSSYLCDPLRICVCIDTA